MKKSKNLTFANEKQCKLYVSLFIRCLRLEFVSSNRTVLVFSRFLCISRTKVINIKFSSFSIFFLCVIMKEQRSSFFHVFRTSYWKIQCEFYTHQKVWCRFRFLSKNSNPRLSFYSFLAFLLIFTFNNGFRFLFDMFRVCMCSIRWFKWSAWELNIEHTHTYIYFEFSVRSFFMVFAIVFFFFSKATWQ